jgi:hypothetical protein
MSEQKKERNELEISERDVYDEHMRAVNVPAHWAYFFSVVLGGLVLMLLLITLLGS